MMWSRFYAANGLNPEATVHYTDRFIMSRICGCKMSPWDILATVGNLRNLRVYLSADNLFIITDYQDMIRR
jgi:hypothetical protein